MISEGIAAVDAIKESALAEPKTYIDAVLTVYKKYAKVVLDAFVFRVERTCHASHVELIAKLANNSFLFLNVSS